MGVLDLLSQEDQRRVRPEPQPRWVDPMLATLTHSYFSDPEWLYERKLDGERCLALHHGDDARLLTRNRHDVARTYPEVARAVSALASADLIADGEVVAFDGTQTSFAKLQSRMQLTAPGPARQREVPVYYYVFDLLHWDGWDLTRLPLRTRKRLLRKALPSGQSQVVRISAHRVEHGETFYRQACQRGWEGLIAKRGHASYAHGRSRDWLKFKCVRDQDLVIGGFTEPRGGRRGLGALLVGYYDDGNLAYAGKVGTGYSEQTLAELRRRLDRITADAAPFTTKTDDLPRRDVHWVRPELVAQVAFTEWTSDDRLRHPRYQGLRRDKSAHDVVRETT